ALRLRRFRWSERPDRWRRRPRNDPGDGLDRRVALPRALRSVAGLDLRCGDRLRSRRCDDRRRARAVVRLGLRCHLADPDILCAAAVGEPRSHRMAALRATARSACACQRLNGYNRFLTWPPHRRHLAGTERRVQMPICYIEAPPGISEDAKKKMMEKITAA